MGHCPWSHQTSADEHVHHVDGRQLYLHLPHHDGGHDVLQTNPGYHGHTEQSVSFLFFFSFLFIFLV
jgi:hypothetical protein